MCPAGRPISLSAPAKPNPCSRPKVKATIHGMRAARPARPRRGLQDFGGDEHDAQRDHRLDRLAAAHGRRRASPAPRVMLCATVNAVTVFTSRHVPVGQEQQRQHEQQVVDAGQDVLDPKPEIGAGDLPGTAAARE